MNPQTTDPTRHPDSRTGSPSTDADAETGDSAEAAVVADLSDAANVPVSASTAPVLANRSRSRPSLIVIVSERWLRGELDVDGVCQGVNGDPVSIVEARRLACTADIIPVVMGGDGRILDVGRKRRWVTDAQWLALLGRDRGCVVNGCNAPEAHCEAHHCLPWEHGGRTDLINLIVMCARHHRELHHCGWTARVDGGRAVIVDRNGNAIPTNPALSIDSTGPP